MKNLNSFSQIFSEKFNLININEVPLLEKTFVGVVFKMSNNISRTFVNRGLSVIKFISFQRPKITKLKYFYISKQKNFVFTAHSTLRAGIQHNFFHIFYKYLFNHRFFSFKHQQNNTCLINTSENGSLICNFSNFYTFSNFKNFFYNWTHPLSLLFLLKFSNIKYTNWILSFYGLLAVKK